MATKTNAGTRKTKKTKEQILKERRAERTDLGSMRDVMRTPEIEGFVVRWVNDEFKGGVNRIGRLKSLGWVLVDENTESDAPTNVTESNVSLGTGTELIAGTTAEGKPMRAVLMMIDRDIYEADQQLKEESIREIEDGIFELQKEEGMYGAVNVGRQ